MAKSSPSANIQYVDTQIGWRGLFFSIAIAGIVGLSFRLYFSPHRIQSFVQMQIDRQSATERLTFENARLSLSRGAIPQFAIVLRGVKFAPQPECYAEPSLIINELTLPFRLTSLPRGQAAIGTISAEGMLIDLDGMKRHCEKASSAIFSPKMTTRSVAAEPAKAEAKPWWTPEQLHSVQKSVEGFDFKRVELQFENKTKRVYLDSFALHSGVGDADVEASTELKFPPELVFGENVPKLSIQAVAQADVADVKINANLDEGHLRASARLTPSNDGGLLIDLHLLLNEVPLSTVVPLLIKAGIAQERFKPKFLWLDCGAHIQGPFQGLFNTSPLYLEKCSVEGAGTHVELESAIRRASGKWDPFSVHLASVDLNRLTEVFSLEGPRGVASDFGRLTGDLELQDEDNASFNGQIDDLIIDFSNRNVHAPQKIRRLRTTFALDDGRFSGKLDQVQFAQGRFDGEVHFDFDRRFSQGQVQTRIKSLALDPRVQALLVGGSIADISGEGDVRVERGRFANMQADLRLVGVEGGDVRAKTIALHSESGAGDRLSLLLRAPEVEIFNKSSLFTSISPVFFEHRFDSDWVLFEDVFVQSKFLESGGLSWDRLIAHADGRRIQFSSVGDMNRAREISGELTIDYPAIKRLRWQLAGNFDKAVLTAEPRTNAMIKKYEHIDDRVLGLPKSKSLTHLARSSSAENELSETQKNTKENAEKPTVGRERKVLPSPSPQTE